MEAWRAMLRSTRDYYPDKKQTPEKHLIDLKILMGARTSFNKSVHNNPIAKQQWKHQEYGPIHRQNFIPLEYIQELGRQTNCVLEKMLFSVRVL